MVSKIPTRLFQLRVDHFLAGAFFRKFAGHYSFPKHPITCFPTYQ
jgi:hypothetical protein